MQRPLPVHFHEYKDYSYLSCMTAFLILCIAFVLITHKIVILLLKDLSLSEIVVKNAYFHFSQLSRKHVHVDSIIEATGTYE